MNFTRGTIGIGLKEAIRNEAAASDLFKGRNAEDLEEIDLLKYAAFSGRQDWLDWLLKNCSFYNNRGNIKKELRVGFAESLILAADNNRIEAAHKLFDRGADAGSVLHPLLYRAIMQGRHDMAELLFEMGASIKQNDLLANCMSSADDRMKKIIQAGIMNTISRRFRT